MADIEKVIKGLEICRHRVISQENCKECPYIYDGRAKQSNCEGVLHWDALALLKEQEGQIKNRDESLEKAREEIKWLRGMLKEQEVKTGYWIDSAGNDKCSICGEEYSDLYPDYGNTHFCPNCGAKMKGR